MRQGDGPAPRIGEARPDVTRYVWRMQRLRWRDIARPEAWCLLALSALTHYWHLFSPRVVVFDEVYYEHFAGDYLTGRFYFDVHPPLGNLLYAGFARLLHISGEQLLRADPTPVLRLLPATFGTLSVALIYVLVRELGAGRRVALLGGLAALLDNGLLVESRFILLDGFLIFFGLLAVVVFLAARQRDGRSRWLLLGACAFLAGCALSVKWTGASALGVILAAWFADAVVRRDSMRRVVREGLVLVTVPIAVYIGSFAAHFALLDRTGPDEIFMSSAFQQSLIGSSDYNPVVHVSLFAKLRDVHRAMLIGNESLEHATHGGASPWYTWLIMKHPMGWWEPLPEPPGRRTMIILVGNPVVWWGALAGVLIGLAMFVAERERFRGREFAFCLLLGAALLNILPFAAIRRIMFLYHYLFGLTFMISLAAFSTGVLAGWIGDDDRLWSFPSRRSAMLYGAIVAHAVVSFVYFLPFTYGWSMSTASWDAHFWVLHPHL
jgi:dolichyl-phosphate-mannose-protein mannosyltransferase